MSFREVPVFEVKEMLRLWLRGEGLRSIERLAGIDRKTVRRYVTAAVELGLDREGGEDQLTDVFMGQLVKKVRPHRTDGHGATWRELESHKQKIRAWIDDEGLTVVKVHQLLARQGVCVPPRTLERFCTELCGPRRGRSVTVRVADGEPGDELQVDFGRMGLLFDSATGRRRVCRARLILTNLQLPYAPPPMRVGVPTLLIELPTKVTVSRPEGPAYPDPPVQLSSPNQIPTLPEGALEKLMVLLITATF
jgi:hypothetical protein